MENKFSSKLEEKYYSKYDKRFGIMQENGEVFNPLLHRHSALIRYLCSILDEHIGHKGRIVFKLPKHINIVDAIAIIIRYMIYAHTDRNGDGFTVKPIDITLSPHNPSPFAAFSSKTYSPDGIS